MTKTIIDTTDFPADRRHKRWTKVLAAVDKSKTNGYAFIGEFCAKGLNELPVGTLLLHYHEEGSAKHAYPHVELYRVTDRGTEELGAWTGLPTQWALAIRDEVAALVAQHTAAPVEPAAPSADEIAAAVALLQSAGYTVTPPAASGAMLWDPDVDHGLAINGWGE